MTDANKPESLEHAIELLDRAHEDITKIRHALAAVISRHGSVHPSRDGALILRVPQWAFKNLPSGFNLLFQQDAEDPTAILITFAPHYSVPQANLYPGTNP